jgi:hypothetical protein
MAAMKFLLETVQLPGTSSVENTANGYRPPIHFVYSEKKKNSTFLTRGNTLSRHPDKVASDVAANA